MSPKTKGFVKYSVIVIIIAVILGGCKKDDKDEDKPTPPKNDVSLPKPNIESTPPPVDNAEALRKMKAAEANKPSEVVRIATEAKGWNLVLTDYYGKDATEMKLKDINGNSLSISGLKGKKAIIVRWSTGNKESKDMIKTLAELQTQVGAENLAVIAISSDDPAILKPDVKHLDTHFQVIGRGN